MLARNCFKTLCTNMERRKICTVLVAIIRKRPYVCVNAHRGLMSVKELQPGRISRKEEFEQALRIFVDRYQLSNFKYEECLNHVFWKDGYFRKTGGKIVIGGRRWYNAENVV